MGLCRKGAWAAAIALAALCGLPGVSAARTLRAQSVLPPGQSGFVSTAGLPSGTGSPHLYDQIDLFKTFRYKRATFGQPGDTESPRAGVTIVRDAYGVPAVTGATDYDAWWGVGYAVAQDRLFQLELFRRAGSGRLAEILGSEYLDDDLISRRDYYTDAEVDAQVAKLPQVLVNRLEAYRDGINAWIAHVQTSPTDLPGEFVALGDFPAAWTVHDSALIGILLARTVPSGDGEEFANARALKAIGRRNFNRLLPLRTPGVRTTIARREGSFPSQPGRSLQDERIGFDRSVRYLNGLNLAGVAAGAAEAGEAAGDDLRRLLPSPGGSFMWGIRDERRQRAYLFNGPQLGYSVPELFVEFEIHSPAQARLRGVSAAGVPLVGIGHNGRVAWGFTSGLSDEDDLYVEKLVGPESYTFRGTTRQMSCRDETFVYREAPTGLPGLVDNPGAPGGAETERICRTVHGPVQMRGNGIALARRYAIWKRDLETAKGLAALNDARDIVDVDQAMQRVSWNENVVAADDRGHIGYWHPGLHPLRPRRWDERLPFPGTGEAEWRGLLPRRQTPHVIDPAQGWLTNWNNFPSVGWTSGDAPARERLSGRLHRVHLLQRLVSEVAADPSYRASREIIRTSGTTAQQRPFIDHAKFQRAIALANGGALRALRALRAWNGNYHRTDSNGTVDPGVAIWEDFKDRLEAVLLRRVGGRKARLLSGEPGSSHQFDISNAEAAAQRLLRPTAWVRAARRTAAKLEQRFGTSDVSAWREDRRLYDVSAQGAGSVSDFPFFDRGTWEQSVAMGQP